MVSFVNFARIASICVVFHLGTLQGCFFLAKFEFPARISSKTCLNLLSKRYMKMAHILQFCVN